jgi:hypothetical protein
MNTKAYTIENGLMESGTDPELERWGGRSRLYQPGRVRQDAL